MKHQAKPLIIVLAAGEGTRMKSVRPKVLHAVAGRSLIGHVLHAASALEGGAAVVVGPDRADVAAEVQRHAPAAVIFEQRERRGTAHAVLAARSMIEEGTETGTLSALIVLFGDTPLVRPETVARLAAEVAAPGVGVAVMGFRAADPTGYGRLLQADGDLSAIREHKDATEAERAVTLCNGGLMALAGPVALGLLDAIDDANAQREFYLTDAVEAARRRDLRATIVEVPEDEAMGVNDRAQLARAEALMQSRLRARAMANGVTMIDPASVFLAADTEFGADVILEPGLFIGPGVRIERGAVIHAYSHLEGAHVGPNASVGPFARLRPGARVGVEAKIGNFVEIKNTEVGTGAKISHLSYIGDATVGAGANIGAGTITCNYDGFRKFTTEIGAGAFIGSNSALVAPVAIGAGAYVGSGSVVTEDVPGDALAVGRGRQATKPGWAAAFRARPENAPKKR